MAANKQHPQYSEYIEKCKELRDYFVQAEDIVLAQYPLKKGLDHPAAKELRELSRQHNAALRELQQKYWFLFQ